MYERREDPMSSEVWGLIAVFQRIVYGMLEDDPLKYVGRTLGW